MDKVLRTIQAIFSTREVRRKLLFTLGILLVFRLLAHIPVPGVDTARLGQIFAGNQFLSFLNMFAGGTLANFSIVAVGINPYITASIIFQLAAMVFPALKEMQKEGESGRERINQFTRLATVPLAVVQSISVITLLNSQQLLVTGSNPLSLIAIIMSLVAGAMLVMWLGELVTQYGMGNGISMILLAGIVSQFPLTIAQMLASGSTQMMTSLTIAAVGLGVIGLIVFMNEAIRKVTIEYARRTRGARTYGGQTTHLPIRVNVAGVMPIIFAVSIMLAPSFISRLMISSGNTQLVSVGQTLALWSNPTAIPYMVAYFLLVFSFTFFSALLFFNAEDISEELKKSGAFVPGIRPGGPTKKFLEYVVSRISLAGALFLGFIALLPSLAQLSTGLTNLAVGGTSILIVVSVILETAKQVESQLVGQNYEQYV